MRLTAHPRASVSPRTAFDHFWSSAEHRSGRGSRCRGVFDRVQGWRRAPLTLPVAPRHRAVNRTAYEEPGPFPSTVRQHDRLSEPRAPSIDRCPLDLLAQASICVGTRHRSARLCHRESASDAFSHPVCSRTWKLDPSSVPRTLRSRSRGATRRLSTSATESIHEHDLEPIEPRAPGGQSPVLPALDRGWLRGAQAPPPFEGDSWSAANRDVTGQGLLEACASESASHRNRSRRELRPNPFGSGTSVSQTRDFVGWSG